MQPLEVAVLAVAAAIFAVAAAIAGRHRGEYGFWEWSWALLILAGLLLQLGGDFPLARAAGAVCAALFPGLQLAGAFAHVGRRVPRWLIPAFAGLAVLRLAVASAGFEAQSHLAIVGFELAALGGAALLIYRWGAIHGRSTIEWLLIAGFGVIAFAEAVDAVLDLSWPAPGVSWTVWLGIGIPVAGCQILASFDRMRRRLAQSVREREVAVQALEESNERFRAIAEHANDLILEVDATRGIRYANPRFYEVLGYTPDDVVGRRIRDFAWDSSSFPTRDDLVGGREFVFPPLMVRHRDGSPRWVESSARLYLRDGEQRVVIIARDVTERLRVDDQVRKAQKLESLGLMAGGIAHDFNNLLTGILGNADLALLALPAGHAARGPLDQVVDASQLASQLTRQLQAYSGGSPFQIKPVDVTEEIRSHAELLRTAAGDDVTLDLALESGLPPAAADPTHLIQAVVNLAINGAEACGDGPGSVRIATGLTRLATPLPLPATGSLEPGTYVYIDVSDTGHGIDESIRDKVFDPFFTTKATGRGLGLAVVHGVVQTLRGAMTVESTEEKGARCRLLLPISSEVAETAAPHHRGDLGGSAGILVVDDENAVRTVVRHVLEGHGYRVLTAANGTEAEEIVAARGGELALVLLDAVLPGERGEAILDRLRALRPELPVLLMSGYAEAEALRRFAAGGEFVGFLPKPFRARSLLAHVRAALDGARTEA